MKVGVFRGEYNDDIPILDWLVEVATVIIQMELLGKWCYLMKCRYFYVVFWSMVDLVVFEKAHQMV